MRNILAAFLIVVILTGCEEENQQEVGSSCLFFPSAFSPNGDGLNDRFGPVEANGCEVIEFEMQIFNAEFQQVFTTTDLQNQWTGLRSDGNTFANGAYFYRVEASFTGDRSYAGSGTVNLLP